MSEHERARLARWCRWALGFVFVYHGLLPKLLFLSPVEVQMIEAAGLGLDASLVAPLAGVAEVVLGLLVLSGRGGPWPVWAAGLTLLGLLGYVAVFVPVLLVQAFNPVSTNLLGLLLCWLILRLEAAAELN